MPRLGTTGLDVHPLCLGGNVFGWTADEEQSFAVLDAYAAAGGNFIDTADVYSAWAPGHEGGESEAVLGRWMQARGNRDELVIATKVGVKPDASGLGAENLAKAADASLERLQTDRIDLYYAHADDEGTPLEETLTAFTGLVEAGKVRHIAASNYGAKRLREALDLSAENGLASYVALQPHYNLVEREFEGALQDLCTERGVAVVPYSGLAKGFLTGKYRPGGEAGDSPRAKGALAYTEEHAGLLPVLDRIAAAHEVAVATIALAWLEAQGTVPIASARTVEQLRDLLPLAGTTLSAAELGELAGAVGRG